MDKTFHTSYMMMTAQSALRLSISLCWTKYYRVISTWRILLHGIRFALIICIRIPTPINIIYTCRYGRHVDDRGRHQTLGDTHVHQVQTSPHQCHGHRTTSTVYVTTKVRRCCIMYSAIYRYILWRHLFKWIAAPYVRCDAIYLNMHYNAIYV